MPANVVFLDTNGWLALLNASDALHSVATADEAVAETFTNDRHFEQAGFKTLLPRH